MESEETPNSLNENENDLNSLESEVILKHDGATFQSYSLVLTTNDGLGVYHVNRKTGKKEILGKGAVINMIKTHERALINAKGDKAKINREKWVKYWSRGLELIEKAEQKEEPQEGQTELFRA